jgi:hypothetical protein
VTAGFDCEDMHHLVDRLTPTQARRLRLLFTQDVELGQVAEAVPVNDVPAVEVVPEGLLALIGSIAGPADFAEQHDEHLRERMRERLGVIATVLDTGPLVAALNSSDRRHRERASFLTSLVGRRHFSAVKSAHVSALTLLP